MTIDDKIRDEKYNMILTVKHQKYQHYHQKQFDKYEYLPSEETLTFDRSRIMDQFKCI